MTQNQNDSGWLPIPTLTTEGQVVFWDRQAPGYQKAPMTKDNQGELNAVTEFCKNYAASGYVARDVITLGGANGCRDPRVVTDVLHAEGRSVERVIFNDLSKVMTQYAKEFSLSHYQKQGVEVDVISGSILQAVSLIPKAPRRVIIGVYRAQALISRYEEDGHNGSGIDEYLKNGKVLGSQFNFDAVSLNAGTYRDLGVGAVLHTHPSPLWQETVQKVLGTCLASDSTGAIRVVGQDPNRDGFFLSHWFVEKNFREMVTWAFGSERAKSIQIARCPKGYVLCIDPLEPPQGVITLLNNVLGNVLPTEQRDSLRAISELSA